jgi:hypothetical protein
LNQKKDLLLPINLWITEVVVKAEKLTIAIVETFLERDD